MADDMELDDPNLDTKEDEKILDQAEDETEKKEETSEEKEPKEEKEEEEKEKPVEEEEPEEEEDLTGRRPSFKAITAKFPELFKEFPQLKHAFFREQEFSKIFGTVEEAQETYDKMTQFAELETSIMTGDPTDLLTQIKRADEDTVKRFVTNFIPSLWKNESLRDLYYTATIPVIQDVLRYAYTTGEKNGNKNLKYAAQFINQLLFDTTEIAAPRRDEANPEREKFEKEKSEFYQQRYQEFRTTVDNEIVSSLEKVISSGLEDSISPFLRGKITEEVWKQLDKQLNADPQHKKLMDSLWRRAMQGGLTKEHQTRLIKAYLDRARPLVPAVRDKVRKAAMATSQEKKETTPTGKHKDLTGGPTKTTNIKNFNIKQVSREVSDADILDAAFAGKPIPLTKR